MKRIAIIGGGASAAAAHLAVRQHATTDTEIIVVTPQNRTTRKNQISKDEKDPFLKINLDEISNNDNGRVISTLANQIIGSRNIGGWTEYWGATMWPWNLDTIEKFGSFSHQLHSAYESVNQIVPTLAVDYVGKKEFPMFTDRTSYRAPSKMFTELSNSFEESNDFVFVNSRLAISPLADYMTDGCTRCGQCLSGCPGNHIWSARHYFELIDNPECLIDMYVEKIVYEEKYQLMGQNSQGESFEISNIDKVIVATGAISSSILLIKSGIIDRALIQDSPMTLIPFWYRGKKSKLQEKKITLSEVFLIYLGDRKIADTTFAQCYSMNIDIRNRIVQRFGLLRLIPRNLLDPLINLFSVAMFFQDSKLGGTIAVSRMPNGSVRVSPHEERKAESTEQLKRLTRQLRKNGIFTLFSARYEARVGEGFHFGSSSFFIGERGPIRINISDGEIEDFANLHIVDSSALPTIPCFPTTYTTMANAFRLGREIVKNL